MRNGGIRYLLPIAFFFLLLFFLWRGLNVDPMHIPSPLINKSLPSFVAMRLENSPKKLTEKVFFGHLSLLIVWSSWCVTCREEQEFLLNLKKSSKLRIMGLDYRDDLKVAKLWLKRYGNPFDSVIFDPQGSLGVDLGVYGVPESFLIDEKGVIRYKHIGPLSKAVWNRELRPLLSQYGKDYG